MASKWQESAANSPKNLLLPSVGARKWTVITPQNAKKNAHIGAVCRVLWDIRLNKYEY